MKLELRIRIRSLPTFRCSVPFRSQGHCRFTEHLLIYWRATTPTCVCSCRKQGFAFIWVGFAFPGFTLSCQFRMLFLCQGSQRRCRIWGDPDSVPLAGAGLCFPLVNSVLSVTECDGRAQHATLRRFLTAGEVCLTRC